MSCRTQKALQGTIGIENTLATCSLLIQAGYLVVFVQLSEHSGLSSFVMAGSVVLNCSSDHRAYLAAKRVVAM